MKSATNIIYNFKIPGLPYERKTIESSLDPVQFQERLKSYTISIKPMFKDVSDDYMFIGKITGHSFKLIPITKWRNTYLPWVIGSYFPGKVGCSATIIFTIHPVAIILMLFFLIFPQYLFITRGSSFNILYATCFMIFHFVLYYVGFLPEVKRIERFFKISKL
jgi:hypothetical protein